MKGYLLALILRRIHLLLHPLDSEHGAVDLRTYEGKIIKIRCRCGRCFWVE